MKSLLNIWTREIRATCFSLRPLQTFPRYEKKHFRFELYKAERPRNIMFSELFYFCLVMLSLRLGILIFSFVYSCFFFQCKYRNYSSTEIQWIRDSGNESCSQERTNQVSQFRNESTTEGKLFMTSISGIFVVSAEATLHTSAEKFRTQHSPFIKWFWICGSGKLWKRNLIVIMISSFTKSAVFKMLSVHKMRSRLF